MIEVLKLGGWSFIELVGGMIHVKYVVGEQ